MGPLLLLLAAGCWNGQDAVQYSFSAEGRSWWSKQPPKVQGQHLEAAGIWRGEDYPAAHIQQLETGFVAIHPHCAKKRCRIRVSLLDASMKPTGRYLDLDPGPEAVVTGSALDDIDGDGAKELVVRQYGRVKQGKNKKTIAVMAHVIEVPSLERAVRLDLGWFTSWPEDEPCETIVSRNDDRCSGHPSLRALQTCQKKTKAWRYDFDPSTSRFVEDRRVWAVIAGAVEQVNDNVSPLADEKLAAVKKAGFVHAVLDDSFVYAKMKCCFDVVLVGRFETKAEAMAVLERVRAKKIDAYVKRVF